MHDVEVFCLAEANDEIPSGNLADNEPSLVEVEVKDDASEEVLDVTPIRCEDADKLMLHINPMMAERMRQQYADWVMKNFV